jgi:hypothetical protein
VPARNIQGNDRDLHAYDITSVARMTAPATPRDYALIRKKHAEWKKGLASSPRMAPSCGADMLATSIGVLRDLAVLDASKEAVGRDAAGRRTKFAGF